MKSLFLIFLFCILSIQLHSQKPPMEFKSYTFDTGLPMGETYKIVQDKYKFLWLFNYQMIVRFDGLNYKTFRFSNTNPYNFPIHHTNITTDGSGALWLLYEKGISRFSYQSNKFQNYDLPIENGEIALSVYFYAKNKVIIGTNKGKIILFDTNSNTVIYKAKISNGVIRTFININRNTIWIGESNGIYALDLAINSIKKVITTPFNDEGLMNGIITMHKDVNNHIWVSISNEGIWVIDAKTKIVIRKMNPTTFDLPNEVFKIIDSKTEPDTKWLATNRGFYRYSFAKNTYYQYEPEKDKKLSIGTFWTSDVLEDNLGNLWVTGNGLFKYNKKGGAFTQHRLGDYSNSNMYYAELDSNQILVAIHGKGLAIYDFKEKKMIKTIDIAKLLSGKISQNFIYTLLPNPDNSEILLGGIGELMVYDFKRNLAKNISEIYNLTTGNIYSIAQDNYKQFWMGASNGIFIFNKNYQFIKKMKYPNTTSEINKNVTIKIFCDHQGTIWVGALGLYRYNNSTKKFINYKKTQGIEVRDIAENNDGNIYCATAKGIFKTNFKGDSSQLYDVEAGLSESYIHQILNDKNGNIWATGSGGLNFLNPKTELIKNYTTRDGLVQNLLLLGFCKGQYSGRFYASNLGEYGFETFEPSSFSKASEVKSNIEITEMKLGENNLTFDPEKGNFVELNNDSPLLSLKFTLMNFEDKTENQYYYQLGDKDIWNKLGNENSVSFSNLKAGKYDLKLKAQKQGDAFYNLKNNVLKIEVTNPIYLRWWFLTMMASVFGGIIYSFYKYRINQILKLQTLRNNISRDLHDEVGSAISSISLLSKTTKEAMKTDLTRSGMLMDMIGENAQKIVEDMDDIVWAVNPQKDTTEAIAFRMRIFLKTIEESQKMNVNFSFDEHFENIKLAMLTKRNIYLIFKEAINNVVKHTKANNLTIVLTNNKTALTMQIIDDGQGFDTSKDTFRNGIVNIKSRAAEINGEIVIKSDKNGTEVFLTVPI